MSSTTKAFHFKRFFYSTILFSNINDNEQVHVSVENYEEYNLMILNISNTITRIAFNKNCLENRQEVKLLSKTLVELTDKFDLMLGETN